MASHLEKLREATERLQKNKVTSTALRDCGLGVKRSLRAFEEFCHALGRNTSLKRLDLSENEEFGDAGAALLAKALKTNTKLERLNLSGCLAIDDDGGIALARALIKNSSLQVLDLSQTNIGDDAAEALASMIVTNCKLRTMDLSYCCISRKGGIALCDALENNYMLTTLDLSENEDLKAGIILENINEMLLPQRVKERKLKFTTRKVRSGVAEEVVDIDVDGQHLKEREPEETENDIMIGAVSSAVFNDLSINFHTRCRKRMRSRVAAAKTEERGITFEQMLCLEDIIKQSLSGGVEIIDTLAPGTCSSKGQPLSWETMSMYQVDNYFTKPMTEPFQCSWVEFLTGGEKQVPVWLISHAWSTPFMYTLAMVQMHARSRYSHNKVKTTYWCCTFANNQHDLSEIREEDIRATPFYRVLYSSACLGTLLLCDPEVTPLSRVWCIFELHVTAKLQKSDSDSKSMFLLDVAAPVLAGESEGFRVTLLQDAGNGNFLERSDTAGINFPLEVAHIGTEVNICNATSTFAEDRNAILNYVATGLCSRDEPSKEHPKYEELNRFIHAIFASAELYRLCCQRPANIAGVRRLLELHADPTRFVRNGNTAVHAAVGADPQATGEIANSVELLTLLLQSGADPNVLNSQLCTALDHVSKLPREVSTVLSPILKSHGAKPVKEVLPKVEAQMNKMLQQILSKGFENEGTAFGARTVADTENRLMSLAKHCIQLAATNLCIYPHASCRVTMQEIIRPSMTAAQFDLSRRTAVQRAQLVQRALLCAGCLNPLDMSTSSTQTTLLNLQLRLQPPLDMEGTSAECIDLNTLPKGNIEIPGLRVDCPSPANPLPSRSSQVLAVVDSPASRPHSSIDIHGTNESYCVEGSPGHSQYASMRGRALAQTFPPLSTQRQGSRGSWPLSKEIPGANESYRMESSSGHIQLASTSMLAQTFGPGPPRDPLRPGSSSPAPDLVVGSGTHRTSTSRSTAVSQLPHLAPLASRPTRSTALRRRTPSPPMARRVQRPPSSSERQVQVTLTGMEIRGCAHELR